MAVQLRRRNIAHQIQDLINACVTTVQIADQLFEFPIFREMAAANKVLAWGTGAYGRLGQGDSWDRTTPSAINTPDLDGKQIMCVSAGLYHSAIVTEDNGVYVFGTNATGCLGTPDEDAQPDQRTGEIRALLPVRIRSFPDRVKIVQVSVGGDLMGAHTLAVSSAGRLYSWGASVACGLGALAEDVVHAPMQVREFVKTSEQTSGLERVVFACAGGSCSGVITADGSVFTFGITASGRLGYRENQKVQWRPRRVDSLLGDPIRGLCAGSSGHMMCVTSKGQLFVWGENSKGQLGQGDLMDRAEPARVVHPMHAMWSASIAAGESHSMAVDVNGRLYTWGGCGSDALGQGPHAKCMQSEIALCVSFQVDGLCSWALPREVSSLADHRVTRVAAGAYHSVAVTSTGLTFSWGAPLQVGLPNGRSPVLSVPRVLGAVGNPAAVCAGGYHSLVVVGAGRSAYTYLGQTLSRSNPSGCHDSFVVTAEGSRVWLVSRAVRARVTVSAWETFLKPQLGKITDQSHPPVDTSDLPSNSSLALLAYEIVQTPPLPADPIESILDDWVRDTEPVDLPEIPEKYMFSNHSSEVVELFFRILFLDEIDGVLGAEDGEESVLRDLLGLVVCAQLARAKILIEKLLGQCDPEIAVPANGVEEALAELYARRDGVLIYCGGPMFRDTLLAGPTEVRCDFFALEAACEINSVGVRDSAVDATGVSVDVVEEAVYFLYFGRLRTGALSVSEREISGAVMFWLSLASLGEEWGCPGLVTAAVDQIVGQGSWALVAAQLSRAKYSVRAKKILANKYLIESLIALGSCSLADQVMHHKAFANGYLYALSELPAVVGPIAHSLPGLEAVDEGILDQVKERAIKLIEAHSHIARELRRKLEYYQQLNLDPTGDAKNITQNNNKSVAKYVSSLSVSLRNGPSVMTSARDLGLLLALIAAASFGEISADLAKMFRSDFMYRMYVIAVNAVVIAVSSYLVYRSVKTKA